MNSQSQLSASQPFAPVSGGISNVEDSGIIGDADDDDEIPELEAPEDDGPVDETGVDAKDVDLVMAQVGLSKLLASVISYHYLGELLPRKSGASAKRQ
jgi:nascent polypeptide-associated complex subunit alpha